MAKPELLGVGLYTAEEAARLLAVHPSTVRRWLVGYSYPLKDKPRGRQPAVIRAGRRDPAEPRVVTFLDLAELLVIKGFRQHGIPLQQVSDAAEEGSRIFRTSHPLAALHVVTDGRRIFAEVQSQPGSREMVSLTDRGQYVFVDAVEAYLRDLDFDPGTGMANKWWPQGRAGLVVVDPRIGFGAPHVAEVAVSTAAVYDLVEAGESPSSAAEWFGLTASQAEAAIAFERNLQAA
jgi:uncharacterized protein (DUF433 family)/DNA-binding transcriptional MerR regulator